MEGLDPKSLYSFELCSCGAKIFLSRFYSLDPKSLYSIEYYEWPSREAAGARVEYNMDNCLGREENIYR